jgi:hypothetical protein
MGRRAVKKKNAGKKGDGMSGFLDSMVWPDAPLRPVINELVSVWKLSEEKAIEMVFTALAEKIAMTILNAEKEGKSWDLVKGGKSQSKSHFEA